MKNKDGVTPLLIASHKGHLQVVNLLLQYNAGVHSIGSAQGAMDIASTQGHERVVDGLLSSTASLNEKKKKRKRLWHCSHSCQQERISGHCECPATA